MSSLTMLPRPVFSPVLTAMTKHSSSASIAFHTWQHRKDAKSDVDWDDSKYTSLEGRSQTSFHGQEIELCIAKRLVSFDQEVRHARHTLCRVIANVAYAHLLNHSSSIYGASVAGIRIIRHVAFRYILVLAHLCSLQQI